MATDSPQTKSSDRKRKANDASNNTKILADCTLKQFAFYFLRVSLVTQDRSSISTKMDELTVKKHFTAAMHQRFGILGSAVPLDILKLEGDDAWIRVPFEDRSIVPEALSGWNGNGIAWNIKESGCWLGGLTGSNGRDLFDD